MPKSSEFEILLSSDSEYKEITVEIFCHGKFVALLNQDEGIENIKIEFPGTVLNENEVLRTVDLELFEKALRAAKIRIGI